MSSIADILSFTKPLPEDNPKVAAAKELKCTSKHIFNIRMVLPDDKESLEGDQGIWIGQWDDALVCGSFLWVCRG